MKNTESRISVIPIDYSAIKELEGVGIRLESFTKLVRAIDQTTKALLPQNLRHASAMNMNMKTKALP